MTSETLIIPSESRNREFDGKLLLGCVAAEAGFRAIVGSRHDIHAWIDHLPRSIYIGKDLRSSSAAIVRILTRLGHAVVAWDEEALVYYNREQYLASRVHPATMEAAQVLFAWGRDNAEIWRNCDAYGGAPILEVGNPRLDLLRSQCRPYFEDEVVKLRAELGRYILFNSNFGSVNHILPGATETALTRLAGANAAKYYTDVLSYRTVLFNRFVEAVPDMARAFPDHRIVIRPHPSENPAPWLRIAASHPNVLVRHEGNVIPWVLGAEVLVHNGCTTAIEAVLLGRRVIAYQPIQSPQFDIRLPNDISIPATDMGQLIAALKCALSKDSVVRPAADGQRQILAQYLSGLDGPLSSDRIVLTLRNLRRSRRATGPLAAVAYWHGRAKAVLRRRRKIFFRAQADHKNGAAYNEHRFPAISEAEIKACIERLHRCLGRFGKVTVREIKPNIFMLATK